MTRSCFSSDIVLLLVGGPRSPAREPASTSFYVHKSLLIAYSPVFRAMFQPNRSVGDLVEWDTKIGHGIWWKEARTNTVTLDEDRAADWSMLCDWMYADLSASARGLAGDQIGENYGLDLLDIVLQEQPGLCNEELDRKLLMNTLWRLEMQRSRGVRRKVITSKISRSCIFELDGKRPHGTTMVGLDCSPKPRCSSSSSQKYQRPDPPALGSLVRLYILADKYAISWIGDSNRPTVDERFSLKLQIVLRLEAIHKLIHVVPDKGDITRIWNAILDSAERDPMKMFILNVYASLTVENLTRILRPTVDHGKATFGSCEWHPEFLEDLLLREDATKSLG